MFIALQYLLSMHELFDLLMSGLVEVFMGGAGWGGGGWGPLFIVASDWSTETLRPGFGNEGSGTSFRPSSLA